MVSGVAGAAPPALLACRGLGKAYGGLQALNDVGFEVAAGEIFAVVGPNGAGKTTLFDVLCGITRPSAGQIHFEGRPIDRMAPHEVFRRGLARTFQTPVVFPTQTVLAHARLGALLGDPKGGRLAFRARAQADAAAVEALATCGLADRQHELAGLLAVVDRKRLMMASALAAGPRALLLDEPMGGLTAGERDQMTELVRTIHRGGVTVLLIEHVMKAVQALASRVLVLHHGEVLAVGAPAQVLRDQRVIDVYLGDRGRALAQASETTGA